MSGSVTSFVEPFGPRIEKYEESRNLFLEIYFSDTVSDFVIGRKVVVLSYHDVLWYNGHNRLLKVAFHYKVMVRVSSITLWEISGN